MEVVVWAKVRLPQTAPRDCSSGYQPGTRPGVRPRVRPSRATYAYDDTALLVQSQPAEGLRDGRDG